MRKHSVTLVPSLLAADFSRRGIEVAAIEEAGADRIHVDVMDGHFVPNITGGMPGIRSAELTVMTRTWSMSGVGQQAFMHSTLPKIRRVRQMIDGITPACDLEADEEIDATTAPAAVDAGTNVLVAGSAIFNDREEVAAASTRLRDCIHRL